MVKYIRNFILKKTMRAKENAFGKNEAEISAQVEVEIVSSPSPHPAHDPWARANTVANVVWLLVFSTKVPKCGHHPRSGGIHSEP